MRISLNEGPVWRVLLSLVLPMIAAVVAVLAVSLADTYFVGLLGTDALAALSFTFPVTFSVSSLSIGLGAGASSVVARVLGAKHEELARRYSTDSLMLSLVLVVVVSVVGFFTIDPVFTAIGAEGEVLTLIGRYMRIWYVSMPFLVIPIVASAIIRATGDAVFPSQLMITAAVANVVFTPLCVFGLGPVPAMGIEGAAVGTLMARAITLVAGLWVIVRREKLVTLEVPALAEGLRSWKEIAAVGLPAAGGNMVNPLAIGLVTGFLATFGAETVAGFGVATRIEAFACIPMLAMSSVIGPVCGQAWGAGLRDRVWEGLWASYLMCVGWTAVLSLAFAFLGESLVGVFSDDPQVLAPAKAYLAIIGPSLFGYGVVIITAAAFNGIGRAQLGLGFYLVRAALFYVPLSWLAALYLGRREAFIAMAISNAVSGLLVGVLAFALLRRSTREPQLDPAHRPGRQRAT
ncbi:MAG: MATE family efflux transporter [Myxococcota bacterium]